MNAQELMALSPDELLEIYRQELRRLYGEQRANASRVGYDKGWYYIEIAAKYPDGSVGLGGRIPMARRKQAVVTDLLNLIRGRKR
jgi:hypothetical protein